LQIQVDDPVEAPVQPLVHPPERLVRCAARPVAKGTGLEVRLEDWLQDQAQGPLDHPISDGRNLETSLLLASFLWDADFPAGHRPVFARSQVLAQSLDEVLDPLNLDVCERHAVDTRCTVVLLGETVRLPQHIHPAKVDVHPPKAMARISLRLVAYPLPQVLHTDAGRCHPAVPPFVCGASAS
jgi:hypothetical protein